jgi:uncharacterized protein (DUF2336 family)
MAHVSYMDVQSLINEPSVQVRSTLAAKIATDYRSDHFSPAEANIANDIFRLLLKDVEKQVRAVLSEQLAHCAYAPHDIILQLAGDDISVAQPILEFSYALTEDDLVAIVDSTREVMKLCAIARRETVSERLSARLIETQEEMVLRDLFANNGAVLNENYLQKAWAFISSRPTLLETLVHHGNLPLPIAEKIFFVVSEELQKYLSQHYKLNAPFIQKSVSDVREWQMLGILPGREGTRFNDDQQVEDLIESIYNNGRLTHSLLMRALCMGNLGVFEAGLARLAGVPRVNARILLMDGGSQGFTAIYKSAAMPEGFCEAVRALLRISLEESEYGHVHRADFHKRVIDRIYIEKHVQTVDNMEYLLAIIGGRLSVPVDVH